MASAYKSRYYPKDLSKYDGPRRVVICRSNWERGVCLWCEKTDDVVKWSSESVPIPYRISIDRTRKVRRYYVDFKIKFRSGAILIVEVKPEKQTKPPKRKKRDRIFMQEAVRWATNCSKWQAAHDFARSQGWIFQIWTERTLEKMGIIPKESWQGHRN